MVHVNMVILVSVEGKTKEWTDDPGSVSGENRAGTVVGGVVE